MSIISPLQSTCPESGWPPISAVKLQLIGGLNQAFKSRIFAVMENDETIARAAKAGQLSLDEFKSKGRECFQIKRRQTGPGRFKLNQQ